MKRKAIKLECDSCRGEFMLFGVGAEIVKDDIWKHGFLCPHCGKEYISYYTDSRIRELQAQGKNSEAGKSMELLKAVVKNEKG